MTKSTAKTPNPPSVSRIKTNLFQSISKKLSALFSHRSIKSKLGKTISPCAMLAASCTGETRPTMAAGESRLTLLGADELLTACTTADAGLDENAFSRLFPGMSNILSHVLN